MAGIAMKDIVMKDNFPGVPNFNLGIPKNGFDSPVHSDVTTPTYPIGTKIQAYNDGTGIKGPYTMIYLAHYCLSDYDTLPEGATNGLLCQAFCNSSCVSADGTANAAFKVTGPGNAALATGFAEGTMNGIAAFACASMSRHDTTADGAAVPGFGWFWCGGVCPEADITLFAADHSTDGNVAVGMAVGVVVDGTAILLGLGDPTSENVCGWSNATDA